MGKGTDKLYITHSEWSSTDAYGASSGSKANKPDRSSSTQFKRLPFNYCALSLQPFHHPVCTVDGIVFELTHILPWLKKHGTNPVNGEPLKSSELVKLEFAKNDAGDMVDPVTFKVFTDNTHIVALKNTGHVFAWDTVERLNVKAKMWRDLVSDEPFTRTDIVTLQDPLNVEARNLSSFKFLAKEQTGVQKTDDSAIDSSVKIAKAKEAVARARAQRHEAAATPTNAVVASKHSSTLQSSRSVPQQANNGAAYSRPYNAAMHTTGEAAASFTSTGLTPHTSGALALLSDEEYMLKPRRVKTKGYATIKTSLGDLNIELHTEYAPKAVWNFVYLAKKGYYKNVMFHRNIKNFMIQGGDPTGTGRGGSSIWGKNFNDEFDGPLTHDSRGVVSMANKGKNTNSSQFFITYRATPHLNRKHTIFGHVLPASNTDTSTATLAAMESAPTDSETNRPDPDIIIQDVAILIDPFEEFQKRRRQDEDTQRAKEEIRRQGGTEDEKVTWTGKRVRGDGTVEDASNEDTGVGKYLKRALAGSAHPNVDGSFDELDDYTEPVRKKTKATGGFGNFEGW